MSIPKRRIIPVFIPHLGCEHECVFCDQRLISGAHDPVTAEYVRVACETAAATLDKPSAPYEKSAATPGEKPSAPAEVAFYGGSFTALPLERQNEILEAVQPFLGLNPQNSIRISTRPDCIDKVTVDRLISCGVKTIELGAQSMSDDVLARAKRGHTALDVEAASGVVKNAGLTLILQMMTGLPGDTRDGALYTAERLIDLRPDGVRVYPTVIVKGTRLYDMWLSGEYREHTVDEAVSLCAEIYALFYEADVPVIRLGLNPSDSLSDGDAVAGAYHPSFGELVHSEVYFNKAVSLLDGVAPGSSVTLSVARGHMSKIVGRGRENIRKLTEIFSLMALKIVESDIVPGEIMIEIIP